jgi:hypothetical protein
VESEYLTLIFSTYIIWKSGRRALAHGLRIGLSTKKS